MGSDGKMRYKSIKEFEKEFGEEVLIIKKLDAIVPDRQIQLRIINEVIFGLCQHCWNDDETDMLYVCRCWDDS